MVEPIPEGFRLLHVGPGKTGTTAVQSAFHHNREALAEHGVHYAGNGRQPWVAANQALTLSPAAKQGDRDSWDRLVREIDEATEPRVVISSEAFARADDHAAAAIGDALGRDRTHVVLTMRPPADLLSSNWWQSVAGGGKRSYLEWLDLVLRHADEEAAYRAFWFRTRYDVIAARWAEVFGADNVTAVAIAGQPRDFVLRVFEQLAALPEGILVPGPGESNASLAHPVAETIRQFYEVRRRQRLRKNPDVDQMRAAALNILRRNEHLLTFEQPIQTPQWAVELSSDVAREMNDRIRGLGIHVVGDLDKLVGSSKPAPEVVETPTTVPIADAAALLHAMVRAAQLHQEQAVRAARREARRRARELVLDELDSRQLVQLLGSRVKRRITRR